MLGIQQPAFLRLDEVPNSLAQLSMDSSTFQQNQLQPSGSIISQMQKPTASKETIEWTQSILQNTTTNKKKRKLENSDAVSETSFESESECDSSCDVVLPEAMQDDDEKG